MSPGIRPSLVGLFFGMVNKNAENAQHNARRERLFIRKSALSAIFLLRIRCREVLSLCKGDSE